MREAELLDSRLEQRGYDGRAETALGMMVLGDDDPAARGIRGLDQRVGVNRLDRVEVDDACVDAVERELIGCTQAFVQRDARTDQRDGIRWTGAQDLRAAGWKRTRRRRTAPDTRRASCADR